jgi:hypothetical protein
VYGDRDVVDIVDRKRFRAREERGRTSRGRVLKGEGKRKEF